MDPFEALDALGILCLAFVVLDTYFWIRTTLRLREFNEEIQPRLSLLDELAQVIGPRLGLSAAPAIPQGATVSAVRRTKKGSPFIVINGKARFLTESQAKSLSSGGTLPGVELGAAHAPGLAAPPGATAPSGAGVPAATPQLNYAAMAAELGLPEEQIRGFIARHSGAGAGPAAPPTDGASAPPGVVPGADPTADFLMGLVNGKLDLKSDGAREMARQLLSNRQQDAMGAAAHVGSGGVTW